MKRYLEINHLGDAFHEPGINSPFSMGTQTPPKEVLFCDCQGVGRICHHVYAGDPAHEDETMRADRHFNVTGPHITEKHQDDWKAHHSGKRCAIRRQFFVDVTDRPDAQLGMHYDEATDTFSAPEKV